MPIQRDDLIKLAHANPGAIQDALLPFLTKKAVQRDDLIKLAHANPGPVQDALLPILAKTKTAYKTEGPFGRLDDRSLSFWVTFPNFGRIHHVTGHLQNWDKKLQAMSQAARDLLTGMDIYWDAGDVIVDDYKEHRQSLIYVQIKFSGGAIDRATQDRIKAAIDAGRFGLSGWKSWF